MKSRKKTLIGKTGLALALTFLSSVSIANLSQPAIVVQAADVAKTQIGVFEDKILYRVILPTNITVSSATVNVDDILVDVVDGTINLYPKNGKTYTKVNLTVTSGNNTETFGLEPFTVPSGIAATTLLTHEGQPLGKIELPSHEEIKGLELKNASISHPIIKTEVLEGNIFLHGLKYGETYNNLELEVTYSNSEKYQYIIRSIIVGENSQNPETPADGTINAIPFIDGGVVSARLNLRDLNLDIKEIKLNDEKIKLDLVDGNAILFELVPTKTYSNLRIEITSNDVTKKTLKINSFKAPESSTALHKYLVNAYTSSLDRSVDTIDEEGYNYWFKKLMNREISGRFFITNLLSEKEFIEVAKSPQDMIERIYNAVLGRTAEPEGRNFWINFYNDVFNSSKNQTESVRITVDRIINEPEFKTEICEKLLDIEY